MEASAIVHELILDDVFVLQCQLSTDSVPITGAIPTVVYLRFIDGYYWTGTHWADTPSDVAMVEYDITNFPGLYTYTISAINSTSVADTIYAIIKYNDGIVNRYEMHVFNIRDRVSAFQYHLAMSTGVNGLNVVYNIVAANFGILTDQKHLQEYSIEYDFTTYSKAVVLYYPVSRPLTGDPTYWRYVYKELGGNPTNSSEIAKADLIMPWSSPPV